MSTNYTELEAMLASQTANPDELLMPLMGLTGLLSVVLTLSMLSVVMVSGPTLVNILGTLKDALLTYVGLAYFSTTQNGVGSPSEHETDCGVLVLLGLVLSFLGSANAIKVHVIGVM